MMVHHSHQEKETNMFSSCIIGILKKMYIVKKNKNKNK